MKRRKDKQGGGSIYFKNLPNSACTGLATSGKALLGLVLGLLRSVLQVTPQLVHRLRHLLSQASRLQQVT